MKIPNFAYRASRFHDNQGILLEILANGSTVKK